MKVEPSQLKPSVRQTSGGSVSAVLERLREAAHLSGACVVNAEGETLASSSVPGLLIDGVAQVALAKLQAAEGIERQLGGDAFGVVFPATSPIEVHASWLGDDLALVVCFDQRMTSLGAVRLRLPDFREELLASAAR